MTLFGPGGQQLLKVDSLVAEGLPLPPEEVHWVAETAGEHRLKVELGFGALGPCPLRLETQRQATAVDRERVRAETALARAHESRRTGQKKTCREAVALYGEAQRRFQGLGLPARRAEALFGLGRLDKECLRENEAALRVFGEVLPLFAGQPGQREAEAKVREYRGEIRAGQDDLDGASGEYRRALALRRRNGNPADEAMTASNLAYVLHLRGRYYEAADLFDRALDLWQQSDASERWVKIEHANTLLNRGWLHLDLGETEPAGERFRAALDLFRQAGDHGHEAAALNAMGATLLDENQPAAAVAPLTAARALRRPGSRGQAVTLNSLGVAYRRLGRPEEARKAYAEALPIFVRSAESREQAKCLLNLGRLEEELGHDAPALGDFEQAAGLFAGLGAPADFARSLRGKAEVLRHQGQLDDARQAMEEALEAVERHRFVQTGDSTRAAFFATQQGAYDVLVDLLMEMHRKKPAAGYDAQAFEVSERALARSLLDALAASRIRPRDPERGASPQLLAREHDLEAAIDVLVARQDRLARVDKATGPQLQKIDAELEGRWRDLERVRADLKTASPRYAALTQPQPWSAEDIQRQLLDPDTLLLEYRLGDPRSFLWALTSDGSVSFVLPGRAELEKSVRLASRLLAGSRSRQAELSAEIQLKKLSTVLLGPVADRLSGKRLLVVGDGAIQTLPFAALPEPRGSGSDGEPLVAHHEVVSLPSASVLGVLRRETAGRQKAPRNLWVLADPDFAGAFPPLPYSGEEAKAILALAPGGTSAEVLGREASREAVVGGPLRDYRFIHVATHNSFAAGDFGGGRLVLAQVDGRGHRVTNGFLHLADIYKLDLRADLVVLSACQSAQGREVRGEGLVGMTRGFFYAGAERVLVSLWNVNDRVTVGLMRTFYQGMFQEGLSPAAALRAAQDAIRRQERWRSPYYWAGFALQGEWR